jgi:hypothetical protein
MRSLSARRSTVSRMHLPHRKRPGSGRDLAPILVAIWIASVVRLAIALVRREALAGELIAVLITAGIIPLVMLVMPRLARRL